jgi:tRNA pseudouridine13 synthase
VLSARVTDGSWQQALPGEALIQPYSRSTLSLRFFNDEIRERIAKGMLQPSAPLWGKGESAAQGAASERENRALAEEGLFMRGLEKAGVEPGRRALCLLPRQLRWQWLEGEVMQLSFSLPAGGYATAILRELVQVRDATR